MSLDAKRRKQRAALNDLQQRHETLTPRERQVFRLVVEGSSNRKIAELMELSQKTVEVHRAHVMSKMFAGSLAGLVRMAVALEVAAGEDPLESLPSLTAGGDSGR